MKNKTKCLDCPEDEMNEDTEEFEGWEQEVLESVDDDDGMSTSETTEEVEVPSEVEETITETDSTGINN